MSQDLWGPSDWRDERKWALLCDNMRIPWAFGLYPGEQGMTMIPTIPYLSRQPGFDLYREIHWLMSSVILKEVPENPTESALVRRRSFPKVPSSPASWFRGGWGNFYRIRKVATCTSSLPARWSTSGSRQGWSQQNSCCAGRVGWQRSFRARSKSTAQKKLMIWTRLNDILYQLLNPPCTGWSSPPQPRFGIHQIHPVSDRSEHNQCWWCFVIFGCASQPSGSESRLLRGVSVTRFYKKVGTPNSSISIGFFNIANHPAIGVHSYKPPNGDV